MDTQSAVDDITKAFIQAFCLTSTSALLSKGAAEVFWNSIGKPAILHYKNFHGFHLARKFFSMDKLSQNKNAVQESISIDPNLGRSNKIGRH